MNMLSLVSLFFSGYLFGVFAEESSLQSISVKYDSDTWNKFSSFQVTFHKKYDSLDELEKRFDIFKLNYDSMLDHNKASLFNFTLGVNQFSDLTSQEFKEQFISGFNPHAQDQLYGTTLGSYDCNSFSTQSSGVPESFDWRDNNGVTSVKDQGQCGSCWAFSSIGAMEGAWSVAKGQLVDLSEQQLVDCATGFSYGSHGCNGGQMDGGFKYAIQNGICSYSSYPYTSGTTKSGGSCQSCDEIVTFSSCYDVKSKDQLALKSAVFKTPVSVAIEADTRYFQSYSGGVLDASTCGTQLDHGVLVVGYGEEKGEKYWLVKNSWSSSWGENGYVKILRSDSSNDPGICGIAMQPSFPVV